MEPKYKGKSDRYDTKNQLMFGDRGRELFDDLPMKDAVLNSCFFENEGHLIMRDQNEENEIYIHFDAAPLGYLSIAAHGHADALSFELRINGKEILIDPGTFTYHTDPAFRKYFVGTLAHNTIRINMQDQALPGGPTMWLKHYKTDLIHASSSDGSDRVMASHNGYKKLGVIHTRDFLFDKEVGEIIITDTIESEGKQELFIEFPLHLHPSIQHQLDGGYYLIHERNKGPLLKIYPDPAFESAIETERTDPVIGWYSKGFYQIQPTEVIYQTARIFSTSTFKTRIKMYVR
jgi:hypothetical protein